MRKLPDLSFSDGSFLQFDIGSLNNSFDFSMIGGLSEEVHRIRVGQSGQPRKWNVIFEENVNFEK